jgi:hypothetical protein
MAVEVKAWACIIDALTNEMNDGANRVDAFTKEMKLTAAATDKRFNVLTAKVTNLTDTVETIKSSLQGMNIKFSNIDSGFEGINIKFSNIDSSFQDMNIKFSNFEARRMNSLATISDDPLMPLVNDAGASPNDFPATRSEFYTLTDDTVAALLEFYGLQFALGEHGDITQRRLCRFIGMPG